MRDLLIDIHAVGVSRGRVKRNAARQAGGRLSSDGLSLVRSLDEGGALREIVVRRLTSPAPLGRRQRLPGSLDFSVRIHESDGGCRATWADKSKPRRRASDSGARVFFPTCSRYSAHHRLMQASFRGAVS